MPVWMMNTITLLLLSFQRAVLQMPLDGMVSKFVVCMESKCVVCTAKASALNNAKCTIWSSKLGLVGASMQHEICQRLNAHTIGRSHSVSICSKAPNHSRLDTARVSSERLRTVIVGRYRLPVFRPFIFSTLHHSASLHTGNAYLCRCQSAHHSMPQQ